MKKFYYTKTDAGRVFLWSLLVAQILGAVFAFILMAMSGTEEELLALESTSLSITIQAMLGQVAFIIVYLIFNRKTDFKKASKINFNLGWKNILICFAIALVAIFGFNFLTSCSDIFLEYIGFNLKTAVLPLDNVGWLILNFVLLAIVPAIVEELIFRGIILHGFMSKGKISAIFISAGLFSLIHCSPQQTLFTFILGVVLALVVVKTGSVVSSMIIHFLNNAVAVLFMYFKVSIDINLPTWAFVLVSIGIAVVAGVAILYLSKLLKNVDKPIEYTEDSGEVVMKSRQIETPFPLMIGIGFAGLLWVYSLVLGLGGLA